MTVATRPSYAGDIPSDLATKIHGCGLRLDEAQWRALPPAAQQRLVEMPVTNAVERRTFAGVLQWLTETFRAA